jgi:GalNAc-alpha-(1->4)-GalNAc-alpha-(1->3)-diNAcBac-PP-undecaprenol alpha-1,4-N-acetyl-D-galactosaminyltransferase
MKSKKKQDIAIVISDLRSGGTQRVVNNLSSAWTQAGRRLCFITFAEPETDFFPLPSTVTRIALGERGATDSLFTGIAASLERIWQLRQAIKASNSETVLSFVAGNNILCVIACIGLGKRLIISERNDPALQSLGVAWDFLRKLTYPRADVVTANSHGAIGSLETFVPKNKLRYVPNPMVRFQISAKHQDRKPLIINVARLYPQKRQDNLIDAFALIASDFPDWHLTIAGTGPLADELKARAAHHNLDGRIEFPGAIKKIELLYVQASIFVLPSSYEGSPNALLEAMQFGIASVVSNASPGPLEVITDNKTGLVFPVNDTSALAEEMRRLIEDQTLRIRLGDAAREKVSVFDISSVMATWNNIVDG